MSKNMQTLQRRLRNTDVGYRGMAADRMGTLPSLHTGIQSTWEAAYWEIERQIARRYRSCPKTLARYSLKVVEINR